jgi:hypothetical protein
MNRWQQRLSEIEGGGSPTPSAEVVQFGQSVQYTQTGPPDLNIGHIGQIGQLAQTAAPTPPPLLTGRPDTSPSVTFDAAPCGHVSGGAARPEWLEAVDRIVSSPCPEGIAPQRWTVICRGVEKFAWEWAERAMALGWDFAELFDLQDPFVNTSLQGASWFVGASTVTAVTADAITLRNNGGATSRIYRKREPRDEELEAAIAFLQRELANGPRNAFDLEAEASDVGISRENIARARTRLGVDSRQLPGCPRKWRLPAEVDGRPAP